MRDWISQRYSAGGGLKRQEWDLKRCPLCGTINARSSSECVTCAWHGGFDHDSETIEDGLYEMLMRCPELADALADRPRPSPKRPRFWDRVWAFFHRRIDYSA